jgi:hypothetical protein
MRTILALLIGLCVTITAIAQPGSGAGGFGSVGPGGGGGPTNGQTAAQVSAAISGGAILQTNGTGSNAIIGTLTVPHGFVVDYDLANGTHLRTNNSPPFNWQLDNTNGTMTRGTGSVTKVTFDRNGNLTLPTSGGGTVIGQTAQFSQSLTAGNGGFIVPASGSPITALYTTNGANTTNVMIMRTNGEVAVASLGSGLSYDATTATLSSSGGGSTIPSVLGVVTNTAGGVVGVSTAVPGTWIKAASIPTSAADSSWMPLTNAVAFSNATGIPTPGKALVIAPGGTNTYGAVLLNETNWPTGGGSQTPVLQDIDFAKFKLINPTYIIFTNKDAGSADSFVKAFNYIQSSGPWTGTILEFTGQSNGVAAATVLKADVGVFGSVLANGGPVSLIPTNASPVLTAANFTGSLPMGITNTLSGRAQPVLQGYAIDAVGGTPILTASNETTGVKLTFSRGASASITPETNWWMLPITTTNTIWKLRDESAGTGASVGILTNWLIGL